ncbi:MAG: hypothetical protein RJA70_1121, partial [Pseudomonadota bacterium]
MKQGTRALTARRRWRWRWLLGGGAIASLLGVTSVGLAQSAQGGAVSKQAAGEKSTPTTSEGAAPEGPVVVPPELVYFQEGTYPPDALAKGLTAEVLLKLL